jgi:hypothetical protein
MRAAREREGPTDPATLRAEKIARFKRDKEARSQRTQSRTVQTQQALRCR